MLYSINLNHFINNNLVKIVNQMIAALKIFKHKILLIFMLFYHLSVKKEIILIIIIIVLSFRENFC